MPRPVRSPPGVGQADTRRISYRLVIQQRHDIRARRELGPIEIVFNDEPGRPCLMARHSEHVPGEGYGRDVLELRQCCNKVVVAFGNDELVNIDERHPSKRRTEVRSILRRVEDTERATVAKVVALARQQAEEAWAEDLAVDGQVLSDFADFLEGE